MSEIISYKGKPLSLGTEMNLWNVSYTKLYKAYTSGLLKQRSDANLTPEQYLSPDSVFRFRFPFIDEKDLPMGAELDFRKSIPVSIRSTTGELQTVFICQQQSITRKGGESAYLATLYRDETGMLITQLTLWEDALDFTRQIIFNHIVEEVDPFKQNFYWDLITEILNGYHLLIPLS